VNLGPYSTFILLAYAVAVAVVGAMIAWVVADHRAQRRILNNLEARGATRRSESKLEVA
jgi:heme exporter protein D